MVYTIESDNGILELKIPKLWQKKTRFRVKPQENGFFIEPEEDIIPEGLNDKNVTYTENTNGDTSLEFKKGLGEEGMDYLIESLKK